MIKGRTSIQYSELPLCAGCREMHQWQTLPSPVQCEETVTRTRDLPVTGGKTLPLATGPPFLVIIFEKRKFVISVTNRAFYFYGNVHCL